MNMFFSKVAVLVGFVFLAVVGTVHGVETVKGSAASHSHLDRAAQVERAINQ